LSDFSAFFCHAARYHHAAGRSNAVVCIVAHSRGQETRVGRR